ncbi:unnamed protein product [Acanthosepion pharaonis]|uniref:Uncharacterized protein n=1 Tax=Acanthosepion pharaonis TaxID=158019 RepID=A0A812ETM0_ACAPH|nr:unnamed protein product [Sepia pharaonis]
MTEKLQLIDPHPDLFLWKNSFSLPSVLYTLRSTPCYLEQDFLNEIDITIKRCAELICNVNFDDTGWRQAKLPLSFGGLSLRSAVDLALPAYLSSLSSSRELIDEILGGSSQCFSGISFEQTCSAWAQKSLSIPLDTSKQKSWDKIKCETNFTNLRLSLDQHRLACLLSASQPIIGAWLNAVPSSSTGGLRTSQSIYVATLSCFLFCSFGSSLLHSLTTSFTVSFLAPQKRHLFSFLGFRNPQLDFSFPFFFVFFLLKLLIFFFFFFYFSFFLVFFLCFLCPFLLPLFIFAD